MTDPSDPTTSSKPRQEDQPGQEDALLVGEFREEKGGALLKVELPSLQSRINFGGKTFLLKPETHVTLVGFAAKLDKRYKMAEAARGEDISNSVAAERVKASLQKAAESMTFQIRLSPETRRAKKDEAEAIIKMCEVNGLVEYLRRVTTELGFAEDSIELPPTHITVYTLENGLAIGIATQQQLAELTTPLSAVELEELRRVSALTTT